MDSAQDQPGVSSERIEKKNTQKTISAIEGIAMGLILLVVILFTLNYFNIISLSTIFPILHFLPHKQLAAQKINTNSIGQSSGLTNQQGVVEKVGNEYIYQQDLNTELASYPVTNGIDAKKLLLQKIAKDSITLQAAQKEGLIQLDSSVFNSPKKDYTKRIALVNQIEQMIDSKQNNISGNVISIWFFNDKAGAVGYDKGKEIAQSTITSLYNQVKGKTITIQQAGQQIQNDTALAQVDTQYKTNALFTFKAGATDKISFDPAFDALIRKLQPGKITPLYLAKDKDLATGQMIDAVYMFAEVSSIKTDGQAENYNQWYAEQQKNYAVALY